MQKFKQLQSKKEKYLFTRNQLSQPTHSTYLFSTPNTLPIGTTRFVFVYVVFTPAHKQPICSDHQKKKRHRKTITNHQKQHDTRQPNEKTAINTNMDWMLQNSLAEHREWRRRRKGRREGIGWGIYRDGSSVTLTFLIPTSIYRSFSFQIERPDPGANSCEQVQATTARGVSPIARGDGGGGSPEAADTGGRGRRGGEHVGPLMVYHQRWLRRLWLRGRSSSTLRPPAAPHPPIS